MEFQLGPPGGSLSENFKSYSNFPSPAPKITVTVAEALALPPLLVQVKVYVWFAAKAPVEVVPAVGLLPLQAPPAVQELALVLSHVRVELCPLVMDVGLTVRLTVGGMAVAEGTRL